MPRGLASGQAGGGTNFSSFPSLSLLLIFSSLLLFSAKAVPPSTHSLRSSPLWPWQRKKKEKRERRRRRRRGFFFLKHASFSRRLPSPPPLFLFSQISSDVILRLSLLPSAPSSFIGPPPPPFPFNARRRRLPFPPQFAKATAPLRNALPTFHT